MIFAQRKQDVDAIHEYLLLKGIEAVAIHGGKGRNIQIKDFIKSNICVFRSRRTILCIRKIC